MQVLAVKCALGCRWDAGIGLICWQHHDRLADLLDPTQRGQIFAKPGDRRTPPSIPQLYAQLSAERGRHGIPAIGPTGFASASPADDQTIVLRDPRSRPDVAGPDDIEHAPDAPLAVLYRLAERVIDERGTPERHPEHTVASYASWLHSCVDWISTQPWIGEAWAALRTLSASLRAAVGDPTPGRVGACWVLVDDDGRPDPAGAWRCATPLYMPEQPPRAPDEPIQLPTLRCSGCGHHYSGAELVQLGRLVEQQPIAS
jgi:hypothetical protein